MIAYPMIIRSNRTSVIVHRQTYCVCLYANRPAPLGTGFEEALVANNVECIRNMRSYKPVHDFGFVERPPHGHNSIFKKHGPPCVESRKYILLMLTKCYSRHSDRLFAAAAAVTLHPSITLCGASQPLRMRLRRGCGDIGSIYHLV